MQTERFINSLKKTTMWNGYDILLKFDKIKHIKGIKDEPARVKRSIHSKQSFCH